MSLRIAVTALLVLSLSCATATPARSNVAPVQSIYDSFARGDAAAVLANFDPNIIWYEAESLVYADRNPYRGPQAIGQHFGRLMSDLVNFRIRVDNLVADDDQVVALGRYSATWKATSRPIDAQFAHVWTIRDGKIIAFQQYTDTEQFARVQAP